MKKRILFFALCVMFAFSANAQEDYSVYLNKAMEKIEAGDCEGAQRFYNVYKELSGETKSSIELLIEDCRKDKQTSVGKPKSKINLMDNSYCLANKNRYVAWGIAGAGYPWKLITSIEFRGGSIIGVGLYGDIGMDFINIEYSNPAGSDWYYHGNTTKVGFRYAGGIKFYPYKGLFLDCGYGTISEQSIYVHASTIDAAKKAVKSSHGILFHVGYNLTTDISSGPGFFLGISGGATYDVINKVFAPSVNLKLGVTWGWKQ